MIGDGGSQFSRFRSEDALVRYQQKGRPRYNLVRQDKFTLGRFAGVGGLHEHCHGKNIRAGRPTNVA